ncbi:hypothetical protein F5Y17DRAFT_359408 [Xylariaceae sp. FL0594]|nr:hypothetical protein F5Y17DRAFT_359408 [Xylariaceae sp. FL0594]
MTSETWCNILSAFFFFSSISNAQRNNQPGQQGLTKLAPDRRKTRRRGKKEDKTYRHEDTAQTYVRAQPFAYPRRFPEYAHQPVIVSPSQLCM